MMMYRTKEHRAMVDWPVANARMPRMPQWLLGLCMFALLASLTIAGLAAVAILVAY